MEKEFIKAYNDVNLTVYDIKTKCGLNNHNYRKLKTQLIEEGKIEPNRHINYTDAKYTTVLANGSVAIRKCINGETNYYGCYPTMENANTVIAELKKHDWEINKAKPVMNQMRQKHKNYVKIGDRYYVCKTIGGKRKYYDSFKCEQDARESATLLQLVGWDQEKYEKMKVIQ